MPKKPSASHLVPTLGLLVLSTGLGVIFCFIGRWQNLPCTVAEFIALSLAVGVLYVVGVYLVESFILGASALLVIVLGALFFRLCAGGGLHCGATLPRFHLCLVPRVCPGSGLAALPGLPGLASRFRP
jgi:hypothetical protein